MPITIICPNLCCRCVLQVPPQTRGKKVRCGRCGKDFLVPIQGPRAALEPGPSDAPVTVDPRA